MARRKKARRICDIPDTREFNSKKSTDTKISMSIDEYEVIRLIDYMGLTQSECARQMQLARTTITSIYDSARRKISSLLIANKTLELQADNAEIAVCPNSTHCCGHCGKSRCSRCRHGECENCTGIYHERGRECYVLQS